MQIKQLEESDLKKLLIFVDANIGKNYFSLSELQQIFERSHSITDPKHMCSFVLVDNDNNIQGLRLAYPPMTWQKGKGTKIRPDLWGLEKEDVAYFQSLFVSQDIQGEGWGPRLSQAAIDVFKKIGVKAIVTHAWVESPGDSSRRYLNKMGFKKIAIHKDYWVDVDYECTRDGNPCHCTAEEMIKYL